MTSFDGNDSKYYTCCCGAHITTLARVFIILDIISVVVTGSFIFIVPALIVGLGAYGVFKQSRAPLLFYVILGVIFSIISALIAVALSTLPALAPGNFKVNVTLTDAEGKRESHEAPKEVLYIMAALFAIAIAIKLYFTYVYWKMAKFLKDREFAQSYEVRYVA